MESEKPKSPPKGLKPCCACPETRKPRDECFMAAEDGAVECKELIEAHQKCLRDLGFKV